jgi:hypothetical protein
MEIAGQYTPGDGQPTADIRQRKDTERASDGAGELKDITD